MSNIESLFNGNETVDERVRILLAENKRLQTKVLKQDSGAEIFLSVLERVYRKPSRC